MASGGASAQFHLLVEAELSAERAAALGRFGRKLGLALSVCEGARRRVLADLGRLDVDRVRWGPAGVEYREAVAAYEEARREFCIQREANRMFDHSGIDRTFPPPLPLLELLESSTTPDPVGDGDGDRPRPVVAD